MATELREMNVNEWVSPTLTYVGLLSEVVLAGGPYSSGVNSNGTDNCPGGGNANGKTLVPLYDCGPAQRKPRGQG